VAGEYLRGVDLRRKYHFTAELHEALRRAYWGRRDHLARALRALERRSGWPRHVFRDEAIRLGLTDPARRRGWAEDELETLRECLGSTSVRAIARRLRRSICGIQMQAKRLRLSRRMREGYSVADLSEAMRVGEHQVRGWVRRGLFGRLGHGERASAEAVSRFLRTYCHEYDFRRVDPDWYKSMVFGKAGAFTGC
jgi:hypothetical protein